ncbi:MAG TPA: cysteine hydrolase family protein [Candidatus Lokiarchaeia archaeon]|nr:cysteine hydrolase family protein [Candidatus Lokiarchaeia archaeon]
MYDNPVLLIIDVQLGMFIDENDPIYEADQFLSRVKNLLQRARLAKIPRIFIQHDGQPGSVLEPETPGWYIHPSITPSDEEIVIRKKTPSSFVGTDLDLRLHEMNINTLLICGLQTEFCIDSTVRHASFLGYHVILIKDAHSTFNSTILTAHQIIAHHNSIIDGRFAELLTEEDIQFEE